MINKISCFLFILLPFSLFFSPFFADFSIVIISIIFIYCFIKNKEYEFIYNKIFIFLIIWSLYLILTSLLSENYTYSFESSLFYSRFIFFIFAINYLISLNKNLINYFFKSLLLSFCLLIFDSFFQLFFEFNLFGYKLIGENLYGFRISSFFKDEYILGSFLSRLSPLLMGLYILNLKINYKTSASFIILFLLIDLVILISGERSAIFYSILFSSLFFLFSKKTFYLILTKNLLLICGIIITLQIFPEVNKRILTYTKLQFTDLKAHNLEELNQNKLTSNNSKNYISNDIQKSKSNYEDKYLTIHNFISNVKFIIADKIAFTVQHKLIYETAIKISNDNFFIGIGPKMFRKTCNNDKYTTKSVIDKTFNGCQSHPHNTYIQILTETGMIGFFFIIISFSYVIFNIIKFYIYKFKNKQNDVLILLYICLFLTLWPIIPNGNFFHNWLNIIYFLPMGFILNLTRKN